MRFDDLSTSSFFRNNDDVSYEEDEFVMFYGQHTDNQLVMFETETSGLQQIDNITHHEGDDEIQIVWYDGRYDITETRGRDEEFEVLIFRLDQVL